MLSYDKYLTAENKIRIMDSSLVEESDEELFEKMSFWKTKLLHYVNLRDNYKYFQICRISSEIKKESEDWSTFEESVWKEADEKYKLYCSLLQGRVQQGNSTEEIPKDKKCIFCDNPNPMDADKCYVCSEEFKLRKDNIHEASTIDYGDNPDDLDNLTYHKDDSSNDDDPFVSIELPKDKWTCAKCTYVNERKSLNCFQCCHSWNFPTTLFAFPSEINDDTAPTYGYTDEYADRPVRINGWKCEKCTLRNPYDSQECSACGSHHGNSWKDSDDELRVGCLYFLSRAVPKFKSDLLLRYKWECNKCKCFNTMNQMNCEGCEINISKDCKWRCNKCKYLNKITAQKCEACEIENEVVTEAKALIKDDNWQFFDHDNWGCLIM